MSTPSPAENTEQAGTGTWGAQGSRFLTAPAGWSHREHDAFPFLLGLRSAVTSFSLLSAEWEAGNSLSSISTCLLPLHSKTFLMHHTWASCLAGTFLGGTGPSPATSSWVRLAAL